jgi:hypothetical protein
MSARRLRKVAAGILFALFSLHVLGLIYTEYYFRAYSPRAPDPARGFVYAVHLQEAAPVYLNAKQWFWYESPTMHLVYSITAVLCFGGAAALLQCDRRTSLTMRWS